MEQELITAEQAAEIQKRMQIAAGLLEEVWNDDTGEAELKPAVKRKRGKAEPVPLTKEEKLELEVKLLKAKLEAALKGNAALLEDVKYINSILAEATGMQDYQVYAAIRERSLSVTTED
jgi:hypothetical protein